MVQLIKMNFDLFIIFGPTNVNIFKKITFFHNASIHIVPVTVMSDIRTRHFLIDSYETRLIIMLYRLKENHHNNLSRDCLFTIHIFI
jgi:hypothetical protein